MLQSTFTLPQLAPSVLQTTFTPPQLAPSVLQTTFTPPQLAPSVLQSTFTPPQLAPNVLQSTFTLAQLAPSKRKSFIDLADDIDRIVYHLGKHLQQLADRKGKAGVDAITVAAQRSGRIWSALNAWDGDGQLADLL